MKEKIRQIVLGTITFIIALLIDKLTNFNDLIIFIIYLIPYVIVSYDTFKEAKEGIEKGNIFNENLLMIIASLGAMLIGFMPKTENMFPEGIFVMLFYQLGELFEIIAEGKSEKEVKALMSIRPDYANLLENKNIKKVSPKKIKIGDTIIINPGEKVPLDGIIIEGESSMNTLAITGESVPRKVGINDQIYSGFINKNGLLKVKVTKTYKDSAASKIIELVKKASNKKSKSEKFITKFSKIYTPIVIVLAFIISIIPSIITGDVTKWLIRGLTFLIVSCPCALVISVPLAFFGGIGGASKKGILFKGSNYLEAISKIDTIIFDKTGTLTEGEFKIINVYSNKISKEKLLHIVSHLESHSNHPIALSLKNEKYENDECKLTHIKEIDGYGIRGRLNDETIYVGSDKLMDKLNISYKKAKEKGKIVYVSSKDNFYGYIVINDKLKKDAKRTINYFKENNIKTIMLTGDKEGNAKEIFKKLNMDEYYSELLPQDKVEIVGKLSKENKTCFVGDGINDSPSLARADIGVSLGGIGQDAAIEASDAILMHDNLSGLIDAINISKKTNKIAKENIIFSITIKLLVLLLSAFGITSMWLAVFADVGVTILAILNSIRSLN